MLDADLPAERNDVVRLADVQVARRAVAGTQLATDRGEPTTQDLGLGAVGRIEGDSRLRPADRRSGEGELQLHRLRQEGDLVAIEADPHPGAAARRTPLQAVDHQPAARRRPRIVPLEYDLGRRTEERLYALPDRGAVRRYRLQA
jgi:hypothetical protein